MSDLIKRADVIKAIEELRKEPHWLHDGDDYRVCGLSEAEDAIERLPSADRPQGKWLLSDLQSQVDNDNGNYAYVCTNCNHTDIHAKTQKVPYCWWCGARMKGADDE